MLLPKLILSPIDFSDSSLDALDVARDIAARYSSELLLVHVAPVIPKLPESVSMLGDGTYERERIDDAGERLKKPAETLKEKGARVRTSVGLANDAAMEILRIA